MSPRSSPPPPPPPSQAINDKNLQSFIKSRCIHAELREMAKVVSQLQYGPDNIVFSRQRKFHYLAATASQLGNTLFLSQKRLIVCVYMSVCLCLCVCVYMCLCICACACWCVRYPLLSTQSLCDSQMQNNVRRQQNPIQETELESGRYSEPTAA